MMYEDSGQRYGSGAGTNAGGRHLRSGRLGGLMESERHAPSGVRCGGVEGGMANRRRGSATHKQLDGCC